MSWTLLVDDSVRKYLRRIPHKDAERIAEVIRDLIVNPYAGDIEKMKGESDIWRRRIGAYRLQFDIMLSRHVIYVFQLERRTSNTYRKRK